MAQIIKQHPLVYDDGRTNNGLVRYICKGYKIIQRETGVEYDEEVIDIYPSPYNYKVGNPIETNEEQEK